MPGHGHTILGISPGTRTMGIVVWKGREMIDWRVRAFRGSFSDVKLGKVITLIEGYIEDHGVTVLALKLNHKSRSSSGLEEIVSSIIEFAKEKEMAVYQYAIDEIKKCFCEDEINNKMELFEQAVEKIPELLFEYKREMEIERGYYVKMFEAIAVAVLCEESLR